MNEFALAVEAWHDFYHVIGDASAALMGLLFVSLSLNVRVVTHKSSTDLRFLAVETFASFLSGLMFSLLFLIPDQGPRGLGLPMIFIDGLVLYVTVRRFLEIRHPDPGRFGRFGLALRFAVPTICFLAVIGIAVSVLMGKTSGLVWFVPVIITLFWIASVNAWDLLLQLGQADPRT